MSEVLTVQSLAGEAFGWFETALRSDGETRFSRLKDGAPEWVSDLVFEGHGHGELMPDDWRYETICDACEAISECDDDPDDLAAEFADNAVDTYNGERLAWLASHLSRVSYCDDAAEEFGGGDGETDMMTRIAWGQYAEASEVFGLVVQALRARLEALGDEDGES